MKKYIIMVVAMALCFSLCACSEPEPVPSISNDPENTVGGVTDTDTSDADVTEHVHSYTQTVTEADCVTGGFTTNVCECGDSFQSDETDPLGHTWMDATCTDPKTCSVCGESDGETAAHSYQNGTCSACGTADPTFKALTSGSWVCTKLISGNLVQQMLTFDPNNDGMGPAWSVRYSEDIGEPDPDFMDDLIAGGYLQQYNGTYYQYMGRGDMGTISFTESGDTITVELLYWDSSITLQRTAGDQLTVVAVNGNTTVAMDKLTAGEVFVWTE